MRKLATIEKITDLQPIEGADKIERALIKGWQVVVEKGLHKIGDLVVYCEIDSLMPERPEFEFLRKNKFRIRTIRLKGQVSQGIAFPLSLLEAYIKPQQKAEGWLGTDVTEALGILKYEEPIPACLGGVAEGRFFTHSIKTDEERIQNLIENFLDYHDNYTWIATEKLDGSSATYTIFDDAFKVASRNLVLKENDMNSFWKFARGNDVEERMREFMAKKNMKALTLQGELIGEGVQKNKYRIKGQEVRFFRAFDPVSYLFLPYLKSLEGISDMGFKTVPIVETDMTLPFTIEELIAYADGRSLLYETAREGIVFVADQIVGGMDTRPLEDYQGRLSFKVISNKFILKHDA